MARAEREPLVKAAARRLSAELQAAKARKHSADALQAGRRCEPTGATHEDERGNGQSWPTQSGIARWSSRCRRGGHGKEREAHNLHQEDAPRGQRDARAPSGPGGSHHKQDNDG